MIIRRRHEQNITSLLEGMAPMETFTEVKAFEKNPDFARQRQTVLGGFDDGMIDTPIIGLINGMNGLPCCFTLQCCYGHFDGAGQKDLHCLAPGPVENDVVKVKYRIAYIALCLEESTPGRALFASLNRMTSIDPQHVQFGCADWFWRQQVNSYVLQVEPERFKQSDVAVVDVREALDIQKVRDRVFDQLHKLVERSSIRLRVAGLSLTK